MNLPPVQASPANTYFFCKTNAKCTANWGKVIAGANSYLESALKASSYASKIIYYDVFGYMTKMMANKDQYGFTQPLNYFCMLAIIFSKIRKLTRDR